MPSIIIAYLAHISQWIDGFISMRAYHSLTVRGQARRLRRLALAALSAYDLDVARLRLLTNDFNGIFRIDARDGQKYVLRVTLPEGGHTGEHVAAEADWLAALARDTRLSAPRPAAARDGSLVVEAAAPGVPEPRMVVVFTWAPGKNLAEHISPKTISGLGELMSGLHLHAASYRPPQGLSLLRFDRVYPFPEPVVLFEPAFAHLFNPERIAVYRRAEAWAQGAIDRLAASGEAMRLLHGDLHQWNVLYSRGALTPVDFEDLMWGWPVQDIATTLYYFMDMDGYPELQSAFQAGYTRQCAWPERYPGEIDAFIAARALGLANFILNDPNSEWKNQAAGFIERTEQRLRRLLANAV
jgi:Ser/Thr protein kinase RdoA (MazF antagonist)